MTAELGHAPRLMPYPKTETWFLGVEPLAEGDCDYCPDLASVVVDGEAFVCVRHAGLAVAYAAEQHGYGHVIDIEATVEPLGPFPPREWVEVPSSEPGRWAHCSPALLRGGIDCAETARRPCECPLVGSHDHWVRRERTTS